MRFSLLVFSLVLMASFTSVAQAQSVATPRPAGRVTASPTALPFNFLTATQAGEIATDSASATPSANIATPSAELIQKIQEKQEKDITETEPGKQKSALVAFLDQNPPQPLNWNNALEHALRSAINQGVPANIIVLVLLFPLIASIIAASRHVIGLRGFGIYIPAVLAVALVSTGLVVGLMIFAAIIAAAIMAKRILNKLEISYLPRTALLLWMVSLGILAIILLAPLVNLTTLMSVNIFPILILVLLSENFLDAQASTKQSDALWLTAETLTLAFVSSFILRWEYMQKLALLEPELILLFPPIFNYLVGKFVGLRLTEWLRFKPIIEE